VLLGGSVHSLEGDTISPKSSQTSTSVCWGGQRMHSGDEFLSPFSFQDAAPSPIASPALHPSSPSPLRGTSTSTTPTLYSMTSDAALYPSAYPSEFYSRASIGTGGAPPSALFAPAARTAASSYGYGIWKPRYYGPTKEGETAAAAAANADAAVAAAEKQRQVLKMEMDLTGEQRRRLEARMSTSRQTSATRISPEGAHAERTSLQVKEEAETAESSVRASSLEMAECEAAAEEGIRESAVTQRDGSAETTPPPCSPSPPSACSQTTKLLLLEGTATLDSARASRSPSHSERRSRTRSAEVADDSPLGRLADVVDRPFLARQRTPSPLPTGVAEGEEEEEEKKEDQSEPHMSPTSRTASKSRSPPAASSSRATMRRSQEPPAQPLPVQHYRERTPSTQRASPSRTKASPSPPRGTVAAASLHEQRGRDEIHAVAASVDVGDEATEERLFAAYQRKLARIQQALRTSSLDATATDAASVEARLAYQRRRHLSTPTYRLLPHEVDTMVPGPPMPERAASPRLVEEAAVMMEHNTCPRIQSNFTADARPLVRRAPSLGSTAAIAPQPPGGGGSPSRPPRQLHFDLARSGNVTISPDGFVCRADAADAIRLIEVEYAGRLAAVLPRLVIPFYAVGDIGTTHGSLFFAFRWTSPTDEANKGRGHSRRRNDNNSAATSPPALAFGFTTHAFRGYGTAAPSFLYLSSGAIAQGLRTPGVEAGAERAYGAPFRPGLELGARLDMRKGELEFFVEAVSMGVAFRFCPARHPAPLLPVVVFSTEGDTAELLYSS
jgi:hypothetical protein